MRSRYIAAHRASSIEDPWSRIYHHIVPFDMLLMPPDAKEANSPAVGTRRFVRRGILAWHRHPTIAYLVYPIISHSRHIIDAQATATCPD
jgi:hypothetical protein